jgi:hypothetical protein
MLVADLDGTMVDNNEEADSAMWEFCRYWEENAVLRGGILVYNTGRSLGQFTHLYGSKGGRLALPDVLVTAVGTKVRGRKGGTRSSIACIMLDSLTFKGAGQEHALQCVHAVFLGSDPPSDMAALRSSV